MKEGIVVNNSGLKNIPSIHEVIEDSRLQELINCKGRHVVKDYIVKITNDYRKEIINNINIENNITKEIITNEIIKNVIDLANLIERKSLCKVINATGIILHTNMGRAPLPKRALDKVADVAGNYSNLEYDLLKGQRGSRYESTETLLAKLTGAESALVVNNNAAAVFLCLNTFANQKEVIVSRSEQIEIGGSFRIPDIIKRSGANMVEVGTTNKTYINDYDDAITENTKILLKVHTSNYKIQGFTCDVKGEELVELANNNNIITMEDLGSGVLINLQDYKLPYEPTVMEQVKKGIDLVTFSGDKLLGGPQAGIIVGKKELIDKIKTNPLTRMVRIDKLSLVALQEVLKIYLEESNVTKNIPILDMLTKDIDELTNEANNLKTLIEEKLNEKVEITIINDDNATGGGSLPGVVIKGVALKVACKNTSSNLIQKKLRDYKVPIICKIRNDDIILSMRTINKQDYDIIANGFYDVMIRL
jgi:L-seryl-tRNA(Ser) seleniumtransferase